MLVELVVSLVSSVHLFILGECTSLLYVGVHVSKKSVRLVYVRRHVDETTTSGGKKTRRHTATVVWLGG